MTRGVFDMSAIDEILGAKTPIEVVEQKPVKAKLNLRARIEAHKAYLRSIQPVEVDVIVGGAPAKLLVPFVWPSVFSDLADHHPPRPGVAADFALWFDLNAVTAAYPGITAVVDGDEDDLNRVRDDESVYCWPELYEVLSPEDRQSARMAVWSLHVWLPEQQRKAAIAEREAVDHG